MPPIKAGCSGWRSVVCALRSSRSLQCPWLVSSLRGAGGAGFAVPVADEAGASPCGGGGPLWRSMECLFVLMSMLQETGPRRLLKCLMPSVIWWGREWVPGPLVVTGLRSTLVRRRRLLPAPRPLAAFLDGGVDARPRRYGVVGVERVIGGLLEALAGAKLPIVSGAVARAPVVPLGVAALCACARVMSSHSHSILAHPPVPAPPLRSPVQTCPCPPGSRQQRRRFPHGWSLDGGKEDGAVFVAGGERFRAGPFLRFHVRFHGAAQPSA